MAAAKHRCTVCCERLGVASPIWSIVQMEMKMMRDANPHIRDPNYWDQIAKLKGLQPSRTTIPSTPRGMR